jgi:hypothetical protein
MSFLDITCYTLGILNGVFMAAVPKMNDPRPSLISLFGFGTVMAALLVFLAMAAVAEHFMQTAIASVVLGVGAFFLMGSAFAKDTAVAAVKETTTLKPKPMAREQNAA